MYRIVDIIISVTKQMEAAESNVCRVGLQNKNEELRAIHRAMAVDFRMARDAELELHLSPKNWVAAKLKQSAHFVPRKWHRSPHDLQTEFPGSRPLVLSQESRDIVGQSCYCHSGTGWMLLLLLLAPTRITNL